MINKISFADNRKYYLNSTPAGINNESSTFSNSDSSLKQSDLTLKQKAVVLGGAGLGMALPLAFFSKKAGFILNPAKIFKTPIKDWALFKYKPLDKVLDYGAIPIVSMATGSVAGGFAGGVLADKNNIKAKKREALNQLFGDVIVPISCVWAGAKTFKHFEKTLHKIMPKIKKDNQFAKIFNAISENIPNVAATLGSLGIGIVAGNKVSNKINEKLYNDKVDRGIRATDFAPHIDDLCMSISMVNEGSTFGTALGRVIPFALLVPGYETGTAREH